jgi:hypothetical protein
VWRLLDGIDQDAWTPATDMEDAEVAVAVYRPAGWPQDISCLVRRVKLAAEQISTDPRARRRRTIPTGQLALALEGVAEHVHGYSFIITNLDVSTPERAAAVEHWYRHRTDIEDRIRDAKHGAALRHLPSVRPTRSGCGAHCWPSTCPHGYRHSAASTTTTGPAARTFTPCAGGY